MTIAPPTPTHFHITVSWILATLLHWNKLLFEPFPNQGIKSDHSSTNKDTSGLHPRRPNTSVCTIVVLPWESNPFCKKTQSPSVSLTNSKMFTAYILTRQLCIFFLKCRFLELNTKSCLFKDVSFKQGVSNIHRCLHLTMIRTRLNAVSSPGQSEKPGRNKIVPKST